MVEVSGSDITIARGDIGTATFVLTGAVSAGDSVKLLVSKNTWSSAFIEKTATVTTVGTALKAVFSFAGAETDVEPCKYVYSLRMVRTGGFSTAIKTGGFTVAEVVGDD